MGKTHVLHLSSSSSWAKMKSLHEIGDANNLAVQSASYTRSELSLECAIRKSARLFLFFGQDLSTERHRLTFAPTDSGIEWSANVRGKTSSASLRRIPVSMPEASSD